ncbi:MAG: hypothetical protein JWR26_3634 [Pedosphaera sp.]|nr:hypothetical protein [Pedosphaera sp.]
MQIGEYLKIPHSDSVMSADNSLFMRAMGATEELTACLDPVANDLATAMLTVGCQGMDGAFKTIVIVRNSINHYFEVLIVFVSTNFASVHKFRFLL